MTAIPTTILGQSTHCPPPARPWLGRQSWTDMLLAHWAVPAALLRPLLPAQLDVDTSEGAAWVSVVAYRMADVRLRGMPQALGLTFPQLNLRTYVRHRGRLGIYFFSLDAASRLAVATGRRITGLPYHHAEMSLQQNGADYAFHSRRTRERIGVTANYARGLAVAQPSSLDRFLTERYAFYAAARGALYCGEVRHRPWTTATVQATLLHNDLARNFAGLPAAIARPADYLQFAPGVDVLFWRPTRAAEHDNSVPGESREPGGLA